MGASGSVRRYTSVMRIRKLARELALTEQELLGLLQTMGHARYINAEQMLPIELVEQVRKRGPPPAAKTTGWKPPEAREIRDLNPVRKPATRLSKPPARAPARRVEEAAALPAVASEPAQVEPAVVAAVVQAVEAVEVPPPVPSPRAADDLERLRALLIAADAELSRARDRVIALERELASSENHRRALLRALATASGREAHQSVRDAFIRRGLIGDDEIALALRAWGEAHRLQELLDPLQVGNPVVFQALLDERMLLVGPGEDHPHGVVPVTVAPDRSERHTSAPVRSALARMATALLVHGKKRLVVHGGSAAWQRELKDGLDPRIDLRFYPHIGRGPLPDTGVPDVVVLWDSAVSDPRLTERHPNAMLILQRGLIPFCQAVVDQVEA